MNTARELFVKAYVVKERVGRWFAVCRNDARERLDNADYARLAAEMNAAKQSKSKKRKVRKTVKRSPRKVVAKKTVVAVKRKPRAPKAVKPVAPVETPAVEQKAAV